MPVLVLDGRGCAVFSAFLWLSGVLSTMLLLSRSLYGGVAFCTGVFVVVGSVGLVFVVLLWLVLTV